MPRGRPVKCIHCGSTETASKGSRTTKTLGIRKIRRCKSCGRRFTPKNQKLVQPEAPEAAQAETSQPVEFDRAEPIHMETPASIEPEEPSDEHQTTGP
jgi:transcriptional regulator NrdR family protein